MKMADEDVEKVDKAVEALGEHFDTVQIFCSRHESGIHGATVAVSSGCGNEFARFRQVQIWVQNEEKIDE